MPLGTPLPVGSSINPESLRAALEARRAKGERFSVDESLALIVPLCIELARLHAEGKTFFLHPSAIIHVGGEKPTLDPKAAGSLPTLPRDKACDAPECRSGTPGNARSSVYSIGAIFYEMLTGESVGPGMRRPSELAPDMPEMLDIVLSKALVSDPAHRPDDLGALASALHNLRPSASMVPPPADESRLDDAGEFEVDIRLSMLPPAPKTGPSIPKPAAVPDFTRMAVIENPNSRPRDPTAQLADLKARLESDTRPRYVVTEGGMDHGPFNAIELLQQIASHTFTDNTILRDSFSKDQRPIKDWPEFAPFAEQAHLHREIKAEKQALDKVIVAEKKATTGKALIGGAVVAGILGISIIGFWKLSGTKENKLTIDDPQAVAVDVDGGVKGGKTGTNAAGGPGGRLPSTGGRPVLPGGMSCEGARSKYTEELKLDGKTPDISAGQYGSVLNKGTYLNSCNVPPSTKVNICAAVQNGRAVGVSVSMNPPNPGAASCVDGRVRGLSFPSSPSLDIVTTSFE